MNKYGKSVFSEVSQRIVYPHVKAWEDFMGVEVPFDENGVRCHIHHFDEDPMNNDILNLFCVTRAEHRRIHCKKQWQNPSFRETRSENMKDIVKKLWQDSEYREMHSEKMKKTWQDPAFIERMKKLWQDSEYREMKSEDMKETNKKLWQNPAFRERHSERNSKNMKRQVTCPHCGKTGAIMAMGRWHFDNCKYRSLK